MLADYMKQSFAVLQAVKADDGYGNKKYSYHVKRRFLAGIVASGLGKKQTAGQNSTEANYTLVYFTDVKLAIGDKVKHLSTGKVYEVLSNSADHTTPAKASAMIQHAESQIRLVSIP